MKTKQKTLLFLTFLLPLMLYAWGDGEKLSDGSCKFDLNTGYQQTSVYIKGHEAFVIIDGGDSRYGTTSTVYNALNCEKITSGEKIESNFSGLMNNKGFQETDLNNHYSLDESFQNKITFLENSDEIVVHIEPLDNHITEELKTFIASLSDMNANPKINISNDTKEFLSYLSFYTLFFDRLNTLPKTEINYNYALSFIDQLQKINIDVDSSKGILLAKQDELKAQIARIEKETNDKFFHSSVKSIKDVPQWMDQMIQRGKQETIADYIPSIMKLTDFGKNLNPNNFFNSIEYKYVLKDLPLKKAGKIKEYGDKYGIYLSYPNKTIYLTQKPSCKETGHTSTSEFSCGFLWMNTCVGTYEEYKCKGDTSKIAQIEQQLLGTTKVANELKQGWKYDHMVSRYTKDNSSSSTSSGMRESECYKISEYGPRNVCLKGTGGDACYGLEDYALRRVCLEGAGGDACYAFKDYSRQKICSDGIGTDACYTISNNYPKQKSCREFSGATDFWLIISSYGYYTWK